MDMEMEIMVRWGISLGAPVAENQQVSPASANVRALA